MLNQIDTPEEDKLDSESMDKFLLTFNSTVRALSNEKTAFKDEKNNVFGFLDQLSNFQIVQLIRGGPTGTIFRVIFPVRAETSHGTFGFTRGRGQI